MSIIYPKNLKDVEKLSVFFGQAYGKQFESFIAREPQYTYMAYLTQTGTDAPVQQVLFSNFESNPVFTYGGIGTYSMRHPMISPEKTIVTVSPGQVLSPETYHAIAYVRNTGEILALTVDTMGTPADDQLLNTMIKLEIWL